MPIIYVWPDRHSVTEHELPAAPDMRRNFVRILLHARRFMPFCRLANGDVIVVDERAPVTAVNFAVISGVSAPVPGRAVILRREAKTGLEPCFTSLSDVAGKTTFLDRTAYYMALMKGEFGGQPRPLSVRRVCEVIPFPGKRAVSGEQIDPDTRELAAK